MLGANLVLGCCVLGWMLVFDAIASWAAVSWAGTCVTMPANDVTAVVWLAQRLPSACGASSCDGVGARCSALLYRVGALHGSLIER